MKRLGVVILCLCAWDGSPPAQADSLGQPPVPAALATSGNFQLTKQMVDQAIRFGQILAGAEFSPSDNESLRGDLIETFQKEPARQIEAYDAIAKALRRASRPSWLDLAMTRYRVWQWYGENPEAFREFQSYPFGRMVLKYNPVLANAGGMIVTRTDVDCLFYSDVLVAKTADVAPPAEAEKDDFIRSLPAQFASLPKEQQEYLTRAELRLASLRQAYDGSARTRAAMVADIRKNVHSSAEVPREARRVENDAQYGSRYHRLYRSEAVSALARASRVNAQIMGLGALSRSIMKSGNISTPMR